MQNNTIFFYFDFMVYYSGFTVLHDMINIIRIYLT